MTEGLTCVSGDVLDLSTGGMRVKSGDRPPVKAGEMSSFTLRLGEKALTVQGRLAWIKRGSLLGGPYEYGVQFVGVSGAVAKVLGQIAMYGFAGAGSAGAQGSMCVGAARSAATGPSHATGASSHPGSACESAGTGTRPKVIVTADLPCFYETLGVPFDATEAQIRAAFRQLAKRLHPDVCKEPDAADRFAFITRVYEVLSDDELRARYDEAIAKRRVA